MKFGRRACRPKSPERDPTSDKGLSFQMIALTLGSLGFQLNAPVTVPTRAACHMSAGEDVLLSKFGVPSPQEYVTNRTF